jgi:ADP-heptose:LPS heptosyltransferase
VAPWPDSGTRPSTMLVWLRGALGDTLLGYPSLRALRSWAPRARVTAVGRPEYLAPAARLGLLHAVLDVDGPEVQALLAGAPSSGAPWDLAVVWSAAAPELTQRLRVLGVPLVLARPPRGPGGRHQASYLLGCLEPLGIIGRPLLPRLPGPPPPGPSARPRILLHPGAGSRWKRWPLDRFRTLAAGLSGQGCSVSWSCGPEDRELWTALARDRPAGDLVPAGSLQALADRLGQADLVISADTGIAHLAALCRRQALTLFGPTDPRRWRPLGTAARVVVAPCHCGGRWQGDAGGEGEMRLRRCPGTAGDRCPCLEALSPPTVLTRSLHLLSRGRNALPG